MRTEPRDRSDLNARSSADQQDEALLPLLWLPMTWTVIGWWTAGYGVLSWVVEWVSSQFDRSGAMPFMFGLGRMVYAIVCGAGIAIVIALTDRWPVLRAGQVGRIALHVGALFNDVPDVQQPSPRRGDGVRLANTRARLTELYGARHTFTLASGAQGRTVVVITLPSVLAHAGPDNVLSITDSGEHRAFATSGSSLAEAGYAR